MNVNPFGSGAVWTPANKSMPAQPKFGRFTPQQHKDLLDMGIPNNLEDAVSKKLHPLSFLEKNIVKLVQLVIPDATVLERSDPYVMNAELDPVLHQGKRELENPSTPRRKLVEASAGMARVHTLMRLAPTFTMDDKTFEQFKKGLSALKQRLSL